MNQRTKTAHDRVVRTQHRDPRGKEHEARHDRQDAADHAQNQQADAENRPHGVPRITHYFQLK